MPDMIRYIYEHNRKMAKFYNFELVLLTDFNVTSTIGGVHKRFFNLAPNFKSDLVRYYALHRFGGIWLDTDVIILNDLNKFYNEFIASGKEIKLDVEFGTTIGCCSLYMKKNSVVSRYCYNYVNNVLDSKEQLQWEDIGPSTVRSLYKYHENRVLLFGDSIIRNCISFFNWTHNPGHNKSQWLFDNASDAKAKAIKLFNYKESPYVVTWTLYRKNDIKENLVDFVFNNDKSVLAYLTKLAHNRALRGYTGPDIDESDQSVSFSVIDAKGVNIGDAVQTHAAINILKKLGINEYRIIEREQVHRYDGPKTIVLMNGWWMHNNNNFPPSDNIIPVFIGFHVCNADLVKRNVSYFKKHEPIGCRDHNTVKIFEKYGIDAYFSCCPSIFCNSNSKRKTDTVYCVDVNSSCSYIPNVDCDPAKFIKDNYPGHRIEYIKHDVHDRSLANDFDKRQKMVEKLMDKYASAKAVVTTRLHCALPCRGLGTKVHFVHKNYNSNPRFSGLQDLLKGSNTLDNISGGDLDYNHIEDIKREMLTDIRNKINKISSDGNFDVKV